MTEMLHYVPILKGKAGDCWALQHLGQKAASRTTPLIEVVPPGKKSRISISERIRKTVKILDRSWLGEKVYLDFIGYKDDEVATSRKHIVSELFSVCSSSRLLPIPVTSPVRRKEYQEAVREVIAHEKRGVVFRVPPQVFTDPSILDQAIESLLTFHAVSPTEVDFILDYGVIGPVEPAAIATVMRHTINDLPHVDGWRSLTFASSSFPEKLSELPRGNWTRLLRKEWMAWRILCTSSRKPLRLPSYADFGIGDPSLPYGGMAPKVATLKYSFDDQFLIWRGDSLKDSEKGSTQIYDICADLVGRPEFAGKEFSQGDGEIYTRATTQGSPGAAQEWRKWATNHYLELVASQLSNLPSP